MASKVKKKSKRVNTDPSDYSGLDEFIKPVTQMDQPMTALFYGKSGSGKTTLLATFPKPILLLDIRERGTESISDVEGVQVLQVDEWYRLEQAYWYVKDHLRDFATIGLDQVGAMQAIGMDAIRKEKNLEADDDFSQKLWGKLSGRMQTWLENYRNLRDDGLNVVFLAHDRVRNGEEDDTSDGQLAPSVGARLMPSVTSVLNGMVSVIGNTFIQERVRKLPNGKKEKDVKYGLRIGPHAYYDSKIRRPKSAGPVPGVIVNPSYKKLLAISRGEDVDVNTVKRKK